MEYVWPSKPKDAGSNPVTRSNKKVDMFSFFKKEKWALVKTYKISSSLYVYHIHLFESATGKRKAEFMCDGDEFNVNNSVWLKSQDVYQMEVYRWLQGRLDPSIPRYDQISEEDTVNYLKGSV